ncbi:MAG: hypothetical protein ACJ780_27875 [Solirubrobacteraceae bacterium]
MLTDDTLLWEMLTDETLVCEITGDDVELTCVAWLRTLTPLPEEPVAETTAVPIRLVAAVPELVTVPPLLTTVVTVLLDPEPELPLEALPLTTGTGAELTGVGVVGLAGAGGAGIAGVPDPAPVSPLPEPVVPLPEVGLEDPEVRLGLPATGREIDAGPEPTEDTRLTPR